MLHELARTEADPGSPDLTEAEKAASARAAVTLLARWELSDDQACQLLGGLFPRTWARWKKGDAGRIDRDLAVALPRHPQGAAHRLRRGPRPRLRLDQGSQRRLRGRERARHHASLPPDEPPPHPRPPRRRAGRVVKPQASAPPSPPTPPIRRVAWARSHRIIRSVFPPIDLFEDVADPLDWDALASAESKTNPRIWDVVGNLALVPPARRVSGPTASLAMAPFVHGSLDRPGRLEDGTFGVGYAGETEEVGLREDAHHHGAFMWATRQKGGWTEQFRQLVARLDLDLHDVAGLPGVLDPGS